METTPVMRLLEIWGIVNPSIRALLSSTHHGEAAAMIWDDVGIVGDRYCAEIVVFIVGLEATS
jgi:hypothetical protein